MSPAPIAPTNFASIELAQQIGKNALAVEVFAPEKNDLGLTWVDWNPTPPDKDMGIWREVFLSETGEVTLRAPFVSSKLDSDYKSAALTLSAELRNTTNHPVKAVLHAEVDGEHLSQPVQLAANESKIVSFSPDKFPATQTRPSPSLVAVPDGRALSLHRQIPRRSRQRTLGFRRHHFRHSRSHLRTHAPKVAVSSK